MRTDFGKGYGKRGENRINFLAIETCQRVPGMRELENFQILKEERNRYGRLFPLSKSSEQTREGVSRTIFIVPLTSLSASAMR